MVRWRAQKMAMVFLMGAAECLRREALGPERTLGQLNFVRRPLGYSDLRLQGSLSAEL
jgi:hypothetical protein